MPTETLGQVTSSDVILGPTALMVTSRAALLCCSRAAKACIVIHQMQYFRHVSLLLSVDALKLIMQLLL